MEAFLLMQGPGAKKHLLIRVLIPFLSKKTENRVAKCRSIRVENYLPVKQGLRIKPPSILMSLKNKCNLVE